jgi:hypothetical protein
MLVRAPLYDVVEIRIEVDRIVRALTTVDVVRRTIGREDFVVAGYTSDSFWLNGSAVGIVGFDGVGPGTSKEIVTTGSAVQRVRTASSQRTVTAIIAEKMVRAAITSQAVEANAHGTTSSANRGFPLSRECDGWKDLGVRPERA